MDNANTGTAEKSPLRRYIGVKIVEAWPEDKVCDGDNVSSAGYAVKYSDGFQSWCPKQQFEEANRPCDAMPFGHAIEAMKQGLRVARAGWNGKGMFAVISEGYLLEAEKFFNKDLQKHAVKLGGFMKVRDCFLLKTAQDDAAYWSPSTSDCLADDWQIVE